MQRDLSPIERYVVSDLYTVSSHLRPLRVVENVELSCSESGCLFFRWDIYPDNRAMIAALLREVNFKMWMLSEKIKQGGNKEFYFKVSEDATEPGQYCISVVALWRRFYSDIRNLVDVHNVLKMDACGNITPAIKNETFYIR